MNIACSLLSEDDYRETVDLLTDAFCRNDPIEIALEITPDEFRKMIEPEIDAVLDNGLCLVARNAENGRLVGALLASDALAENVDSCGQASPKFKPISEIARDFSQSYLQNRSLLPGSCLYLFVIGVDPDLTGKGIGQRLTRLSLENARKRGYRSAYAMATNRASVRCLEQHGFRSVRTLDYQTYRFRGDAVFASITEHPGITLMECDNLAGCVAGLTRSGRA